jgi:hypothetical protein
MMNCPHMGHYLVIEKIESDGLVKTWTSRQMASKWIYD